MTEESPRRLGPEEVRYVADLSDSGIETTDDLSPSIGTVGQPEALEALELGLTIGAPGYNIYLAGLRGTGRFAAVREMIQRLARSCQVVRSYSYVHNLDAHDQPILITLGRGQGREFQQALDALRETLDTEVPNILRSEVLQENRRRVGEKYERERKKLFGDFEERVQAAGFRVAMVSTGNPQIQAAEVLPVLDDEVVSMEQLRADAAENGVSPEQLDAMDAKRSELSSELGRLMEKHQTLGFRFQELMHSTERRRVEEAIRPLFDTLRERFGQCSSPLRRYLDRMLSEILDHLDLFRERDTGEGRDSGQPARIDQLLSLIRSNLIHEPAAETESAGGCPVVEEAYPTYRNLFGTIETAGDGSMSTFLDIRGGSLLRADGGYLLLSARDVVSDQRVYDTLKKTLLKGELEIAPPEAGAGGQSGLKPQPIPLAVRVVLVGHPTGYDLLYHSDSDFRMIFKTKVHFDSSMTRDEDTTKSFLAVLRRIVDRDHLLPFDLQAIETLLEEGVRLSGHRKRLTTHFSALADMMREASHLAQTAGEARVSAATQRDAIEMRRRRHGLYERKMLDEIREGRVLLEVSGSAVGLINGLGYYDLGDTAFGMPARISATTATGREGVVNIEREAELSGSIHDKGVLILSGFLASYFAQQKPLCLNATIAFEQSYVMVDGDSAALAELLALLSSLSQVPLRQDLAVTGSLNQRGAVQPVGGITEKITGFWRACQLLGATDTQGVVIPAQNVESLQLPLDLVEAVAQDRFHIHPVSHFSEALQLLTGRPTPEIMDACDTTLRRFADIVKDYR